LNVHETNLHRKNITTKLILRQSLRVDCQQHMTRLQRSPCSRRHVSQHFWHASKID